MCSTRGFVACDSYCGGEQASPPFSARKLFALGAQDQMTPPKAARGLIATARAAGRWWVAHLPVGHNQTTETPEETLRAIGDFLGAPA